MGNGILIRSVEEKDIDQVKTLIREFHEESLRHYGTVLNDETLSRTIRLFFGDNIGLVAEKNGVIIGCLGGLVSRSMFDEFNFVGQEVMWYVTKSERFGTCGSRLLNEFEKRCIEKGAVSIYMADMENLNADKLNNFYVRNGYQKIQTTYKKNFHK